VRAGVRNVAEKSRQNRHVLVQLLRVDVDAGCGMPPETFLPRMGALSTPEELVPLRFGSCYLIKSRSSIRCKSITTDSSRIVENYSVRRGAHCRQPPRRVGVFRGDSRAGY
jgi:hypothetical protein